MLAHFEVQCHLKSLYAKDFCRPQKDSGQKIRNLFGGDIRAVEIPAGKDFCVTFPVPWCPNW